MQKSNHTPQEVQKLIEDLVSEVEQYISSYLFEMCGIYQLDTEDAAAHTGWPEVSYELLRREVKKRL